MLWFLEWNDLFGLNLRRGVVFPHLQILHHIWENYCLVSSIFQLHCTLFTTTFIPFSVLSRLLKFAKNDIFGKKRFGGGGGGNGPPSSYQSEWLTADWTVYLVVPSTLRRTTDHIHQCVQIIILEKKSIISYRYVNKHFFKLRYFSEIWFFFSKYVVCGP